MRQTFIQLCVFIILMTSSHLNAQDIIGVRVLWNRADISGKLEVENGELYSIQTAGSNKSKKGSDFRITSRQSPEVRVQIAHPNIKPGANPTLLTVRTKSDSFSFFLRDVNSHTPVYIPEYGVIVVPSGDKRSYSQIEQEILSRKLTTKLQQTEQLPETSFEQVATSTRNMSVPIWLGLGRDMRMFEITEELQDSPNEDKIIKPTLSSSAFPISESNGHHMFYRFALGRGVGALNNIHRHLEDGVLPIYHSEKRDDDVTYHSISFASFEKSKLTAGNVKGIHYMLSDSYSPGRVFTAGQQQELERVRADFRIPEEEVVLYCRTEITNTGRVPRYAWIKTPAPGISLPYGYDHEKGFSGFSEERIFCISLWNGKPVDDEETTVLLQPGESACFDFYMPHAPISQTRASALREKSFDQAYAACKEYWNGKLADAARVHVPEKRIDEMLRAGLLHLDLNTMGEEPNGPLAAKVGVYSPIGTESAPIIQFYCSMGLFYLARKSLEYFIDTQQEDGRIMNYYGYTIETGAVLWSIGEYYRYTHDVAWIRSIQPQLLKAAEYLIRWRAKDGSDGSGMVSGKVADPEDQYHQFMLNAYGYLGLSRMGELMTALNDPAGNRLKKEAENWKLSIRRAAMSAMATSPVVPMGDGTWSPTLPPWTEAPGPRLLFQTREKFRSHGTFTAPDAGLGPAYLVFCEVFGPEEFLSRTVMTYIAEIMCQGNTGFSQPYYGRLTWWLIRTEQVKPFLNSYYTTMSGHADRETYTFWEHFYRLSSHKTHEEAGFLMETRWMLYMEQGDTLNIFRAIPREWLSGGKEIVLDNVRSYFGTLKVRATGIDKGRIEAAIDCTGAQKPGSVTIRLPHPEGRKPVKVTGGRYLPESETVVIDNFNGRVQVILEF